MSELSFNVLVNNAEFQKETQQLHEAISGLGADFKVLYADTGNSIKGIEQLISDLRLQIDSTIVALDTMGMENQKRLDNLQSSSLADVNATQIVTIQSEISARQELSKSIENQQNGLNSLNEKISEYERKLKEGKEGQKAFDLGLVAVKEQLDSTAGIFAVASGTLEIFGVKSEILQNAMNKVQAAIAVTPSQRMFSSAVFEY